MLAKNVPSFWNIVSRITLESSISCKYYPPLNFSLFFESEILTFL